MGIKTGVAFFLQLTFLKDAPNISAINGGILLECLLLPQTSLKNVLDKYSPNIPDIPFVHTLM